MKYSPEQEITIDNHDLYIISCINYLGKDYIYAQEFDEKHDDLTMNYFVYEVGENDIQVNDKSLLDELLVKFYEEIKKEM